MTPQLQTIYTNEKLGVYGNCISACVASLTDMPIKYVPYFRGMNDLAKGLTEYLDKCNMAFRGFKYNLPENWGNIFTGVDGYVIVGGDSPRYSNGTHAVIYRYGKPFFDPHPDATFLKNGKINRIYLITKK